MSFSLRTIAPDLALHAVVSGLTCYGLHQIEPIPDLTYLMTVVVINACFRSILELLLHSTAHHWTKKYGYIEGNQDKKITHFKFFHLTGVLKVVSIIFMTIFSQSIGKTMSYQTPSYIHTYGYLALAMTSIWFIRSGINFLSWSYNREPAFN